MTDPAWRPGRVGIVGGGQIGTSVGMALRERAGDVLVFDRDRAVADESVGRGAGHRVAASLDEALAADLVVLAVPVPEIVRLVKECGERVPEGTLLLDTGSSKGVVVEAMRRRTRPEVHAIGGHPIAGTEVPGPAGARADLFAGRSFALTPVREDPVALARAVATAEALGARPFVVDAREHDRVLARTSHLPHAVAFATAAVAGRLDPGIAEPLTGTGFASVTRLARSDPAMVAGFLAANREEVRAALGELRDELARLEGALDGGAADVEAALREERQ